MTTFLHTADWHIGRVFPQFEPDDASALFEARFKAVERLSRIASERQVDAVVVAGDTFDAQTVTDKTIRRLFNALSGFAGAWLLIPGNHDAALSESVWKRAQRLGVIPSNVACSFEPKPQTLPGKFTLLPAPLTQRHTYGDLTDWFNTGASVAGLPRVGLAHGCIQGILPNDIDAANPIAGNRASDADLDYLALGDWHGAKLIDEKTWYAGTPETDRFKVNDSGQALLVTIAGVGAVPNVETIRTGQFNWRHLEPTLSVSSDVDELITKLSSVGDSDVLQLRTVGTCDLSGHRKLSSALDAAHATARALIWINEGLRLEPTEEDIHALHADGFVGEALQELRSQLDGSDSLLARDALMILARLLNSQGLRIGVAH